jgi:hypothetical protein
VVKSYWRRVRQRAWQDTLHAASLDSLPRVIWRLLVAIGAILLIAYFGPYFGAPADFKSRAFAALAAAAAIAIVFVIFYSWHFLAAPAKMDAEAHGTIADLTLRLDDREKHERTRKALWQLREQGVKIRNDGLTTTTLDSWTKKFEEWHAKVLEQAAILSVDLRHSLDPIDKISPGCNELVAVNNPVHQKNVSVMSEMLLRLYNYLIK